jgi:excisionase family DNA binding protein
MSPRTSVPKLAYTPHEAAEALGISRNLLYQLIGSGQLRSIKAGSRRLIPASAINEFLSGASSERAA